MKKKQKKLLKKKYRYWKDNAVSLNDVLLIMLDLKILGFLLPLLKKNLINLN